MQVQNNQGVDCTVLGVLGDTYMVDKEQVGLMNGVDKVVSVQEPYKKANRKFHPEDSVVDVKGVKIGGGTLTVMAGPCSVESDGQLTEIAGKIKESGAQILRGGAFKPRTSPYAFQGLGEEGLDIPRIGEEQNGYADRNGNYVSEVCGVVFGKSGHHSNRRRNMQNFDLLKEVGQTKSRFF